MLDELFGFGTPRSHYVDECRFCNRSILRGDVVFEEPRAFFVTSIDPVLTRAGLIIPKRHIQSPFDMNKREWADVQKLLKKAKDYLHGGDATGFNVGWNDGSDAGQTEDHAHLHIIARFSDEPLRGKGIRYIFKQKENARPGALVSES